MKSTMQDWPLTLGALFRHGRSVHGSSQVVTAAGEGVQRASFEQVAKRSAQLAAALARLGVKPGDCVGSFCWNTQEHLEAYLAVPAMGAVLHTLNIRLFPAEIAFIVNHAQDRFILIDDVLVPSIAAVASQLKTVERFIVIGDGDAQALGEVLRYEAVLAAEPPDFPWPEIEERSAAVACYTSGTTGQPKGVVYSHRSCFLHSMGVCSGAELALTERDRVLPIVPMFHANAWGLPYAAWLAGSDLVLPGRHATSVTLARLIAAEKPTVTGAVPAVFRDLIAYGDEHPLELRSLRAAICGGSATPPRLMERYEREHGVSILQVWGLTETGPLATFAFPPKDLRGKTAWDYRNTAGRVVPGIEVRITDEDGRVLPWDGEQVGEIECRGGWVAASYAGAATAEKFHDGWLRTGDVGSVDPQGFVRITDRAKDVIKSGGEWISSVALENAIMAHPAVREAAVVGVPDDRWQERPLACVVLRPQHSVGPAELAEHLSGKVARWWIPERWAFIEEVPKTGTGKFDKKQLRARHLAGELAVQVRAPASFKRGRVKGDGCELAYGRWGGGGAPVVGLHGITASHMNFVGIAECLGDRQPLIAFDLRGRGDSDRPAGPYGIDQHARDVIAAMRQLGLGPSIVVGHSMGAYVGAAVAAQAPELVSGLVMVDGGYTPRPPPGVAMEPLLERVLAPLVERLRMRFPNAQACKELWFRKSTFAEADWSPWLDAYLEYDLRPTAGGLAAKAMEEAVRHDFFELARTDEVEARLRRVRAPVLIIRAEHGMARGLPCLMPDLVVEAIRRCVPGGEVKTIPGTTHYTIALAAPGVPAVAELICQFAAQVA